jgi:hypothetical protein
MMDRHKNKNSFKMVNNKDNHNKKVLDKDSKFLKRKTGVIAKEQYKKEIH